MVDGVSGGAGGEEPTAAAAGTIALEFVLANTKASQKARCVMKLSLL